jgi:acetyltransferase-like isoleucine patch superfamily enzyme
MTELPERAPTPAHKARPSRTARALRLVGSALDPRAYLHAIRLINYYNYSHVQPRRHLTVGPGAKISPNAVFSNPERIEIGAKVSIGARCHIWAGPSSGRIVIGDDVLFGPEVMVTAAGYRFDDGAPVTEQAMDEADVIIGRDVWLATRVIVLPGARIGDGAIIGAGAIVTGEIPPYAIAVGIPAKVVGQRQRAA